MKKLLTFGFLLLGAAGFSQDTTQVKELGVDKQLKQENMNTEDSVLFVYDKSEYTFTPYEMGFKVSKYQDGQEIEYGNLRKTEDEGFYVLTSHENDEASFGRFDENGNFRALRYDIQTDSVVEENFDFQNPVEQRNQNRKTKDTLSQKAF